MKFLADMAVSSRTVAWLREHGYECVHLRDLGLQRAVDEDILEKARAEGRVLLTLDLDFGHLLAASGEKLPSVILFRLGNESAEVVTNRLADALEHCTDDLQAGAILTVSDSAIRIRRLPIQP